MEFAKLPRSAREVLQVLDRPRSSREIAQLTNLSERTVRHALKILKGSGLVREVFLLGDTRRRVYVRALHSADMPSAS
ncbi:helix-turn-helix domain-containing protein [Pyrococcus yayanosii]|uniref:Uncharacterized protein n=1 Tax=Pyrococcus yayanosii (strain CH1 / JCM 16557) TaxID=529709 RepID=F8AJ71_PYRYC|nr:helix-turn-helix domain-containing protein [Pyrococcus yayanosii]AEH24512.1 hypothetical protein PYCH_08270 [Pyrococcus yayanosii CH1]